MHLGEAKTCYEYSFEEPWRGSSECRKESIRKKSIRKKSIGKKESEKKVSGKKISLSFMYKG